MATIKYDKPVKDLIAGLNATGHVTHQSFTKKSVTIHHNAGRLSHEGVLEVWKTRPASAHFDVDGNGAVAQYVDVNEFAWATGNNQGNKESISIEMCDSQGEPNWTVSDTTWKSAARLAAWLLLNVVKAAPSSTTIRKHSSWSSTGCPGPFIDSIWDKFLAEVQTQYKALQGTSVAAPAAPTTPATSGRKSITEIANEVIADKWGNGDDRRTKLAKAGYNPTTIQNEVNRILEVSSRKSLATLAQEVIDGKWGTGVDRQNRLTKAGYSYQQVQAEVNRRVK